MTHGLKDGSAVSFALSRSTSLALGTSIDDLLFHFRASSTLARGVPHPPGPRPPVSDWNALEPDRINLPPLRAFPRQPASTPGVPTSDLDTPFELHGRS
ncbi:hypothetical protein CDV36_013128 [Fusarium kuroshium]|uniref:Uncharacterized protein n=2 Tax=Fusarium solani species complex TaxID=232080 RepID=A0A3M2RR10_9HYPO|nr:hypothetical protein CDV36_013128 [Fusarium kuroshium]RSL49620.1 hypothetical protein CEP51_015465 [Fusarium floridanum]